MIRRSHRLFLESHLFFASPYLHSCLIFLALICRPLGVACITNIVTPNISLLFFMAVIFALSDGSKHAGRSHECNVGWGYMPIPLSALRWYLSFSEFAQSNCNQACVYFLFLSQRKLEKPIDVELSVFSQGICGTVLVSLSRILILFSALLFFATAVWFCWLTCSVWILFAPYLLYGCLGVSFGGKTGYEWNNNNNNWIHNHQSCNFFMNLCC